MDTINVLLVDDDPDMLFLLQAVLAHQPWRIVGAAASGPEAIGLAENGLDIDVALIDFMMPGMTGLEVADRLRTIRPRCQNVIFSAHNTVAGDAAKHPSVDAFISKDQVVRVDEALEVALSAVVR